MSKSKKFIPSGLPEKEFEQIYENAKIIEDLLQKAKRDISYIEAMVLIHNSIELYLRRRIIDYISRLENNGGLDQEKYRILFESKNKSILEYAEICYLFNIICKKDYECIIEFNRKRNDAVHKLLKKSIVYEKLKDYVKFGEAIKLGLSPYNHTPEDIQRIINNEGVQQDIEDLK